MLALLLADATQQLQPINVTVQQPPGWPVWVTTLFSAAVGALFGFVGTLASEAYKKRRKQESIATHLAAEVLNNIRALDAITIIVVPDVPHDTEPWKNYTRAVIGKLLTDRYKHYFEREKEVVHELDGKGMLDNFYASCREIQNMARNLTPEQLAEMSKSARGYGIEYLDSHEMVYDNNGLPYTEVVA